MLSVAPGSLPENALQDSTLFCALAVGSLTQPWVLSVCVQVREDRKKPRLAANICKNLSRSSANVGIHCNQDLSPRDTPLLSH